MKTLARLVSPTLVGLLAWFAVGCTTASPRCDESMPAQQCVAAESESAGEDAPTSEGDGDPTMTTTMTTGGDCPIGTYGCPCTAGGACDPGLACDGGVCAEPFDDPSTGDGDPSTGDGDPSTGDGDPSTGDGDPVGPFTCAMLGAGCGVGDAAACLCEGCNNNGQCASNEDCVCPDCTNQATCRGNYCNTDGLCHPYFEGCDCPDCVNHPLCS